MTQVSKQSLDQAVSLLEAVYFGSNEEHVLLDEDDYSPPLNLYMEYFLKREAQEKELEFKVVQQRYIDSIFSEFRGESEVYSLEQIGQLLEYRMINENWKELCHFFPIELESGEQVSDGQIVTEPQLTEDEIWKISLLALARNLFPEVQGERERVAKLPYDPRYLLWALDNNLFCVLTFVVDHYQLGAEAFTAHDNQALRRVFAIKDPRFADFATVAIACLRESAQLDPKLSLAERNTLLVKKYDLYNHALAVAADEGCAKMVKYLCFALDLKEATLAQPMMDRALRRGDYLTAKVLAEHFELWLAFYDELK